MSRKPTENIGVADAYLRLFGGLTLLALGAGRKLGRTGSILAVLFGASKVAEGITRYCPVYDLLELTSVDGSVTRRQRASSSMELEEHEPPPFVERDFPWDQNSASDEPASDLSSSNLSSSQDAEPPPGQTAKAPGRRVWGRKSPAVLRSASKARPAQE